MLESKPSRNSQLETHPNEQGRRPVGIRRPLIIRIDFPMPLKLVKENVAKPPLSL
jgi:hypothetical protein